MERETGHGSRARGTDCSTRDRAANHPSMPSGCSRSKTSWAIARSIRVPPNEMQLLAPTCRSRRGKRSAVLDRPCDGCPPCKPGRGLIRTNHAGIIERRCLFRERTALVHDAPNYIVSHGVGRASGAKTMITKCQSGLNLLPELGLQCAAKALLGRKWRCCLDHVVGSHQQRWRDCEPERLRGPVVDDQLEPCCLSQRQLTRPSTT